MPRLRSMATTAYVGGVIATGAASSILTFTGIGLALVALMGATLTNIVIAIAFTAIPAFARIARAGVITQRDREYVQACHAMGFSDTRILLRHILPLPLVTHAAASDHRHLQFRLSVAAILHARIE